MSGVFDPEEFENLMDEIEEMIEPPKILVAPTTTTISKQIQPLRRDGPKSSVSPPPASNPQISPKRKLQLHNFSSAPHQRQKHFETETEVDDFMTELLMEDFPINGEAPKFVNNNLVARKSPTKYNSLRKLDSDSLPSEPVNTTIRRCSMPILGTKNDVFGANTFLSTKRCNELRCMKCDFKVISFDGKQWDEDVVNYLFFRNNYPETVRKGLKDQPEVSSYCCQCSWISVHERVNLKNTPNLNWFCGGHKE